MNFGSLIFGAALGGALVYGSLSYHVLRTDEGVRLVPKSNASFHETYVDVRKFTVTDWATHKTLSADIIKAKMEHLFEASATNTLGAGLDSLFQELNQTGAGR